MRSRIFRAVLKISVPVSVCTLAAALIVLIPHFDEVTDKFSSIIWPLLLILLLSVVLSALLAAGAASSIVKPLKTMNLKQPLANEPYEELLPLLQQMNRQHREIASHTRTLQQNSDELSQITSHMQDGLVILDPETIVRAMNPAAMKLFAANTDCIGHSFFRLKHSNELRQALNDALDRGRGTARLELEGRIYRFDMSGIQSEGNLLGAVIFATDVTEFQNAEQMRREFSANVSHELKTPLQGIIGSADLLKSGMVKPEDEARFLDHIRKEAARLVSLIDDIIHLSQLDEDANLPKETIDILTLIEEVKAILDNSAAEKQVSVAVSGDGFQVYGVRRILHEMIYNLCDNAIHYNRPGGSVHIHAANRLLTVQDTGIGIPPEHQERIFERFYRVDKSHSKASGGTGLGLSIVKHAAAYHNAEIQLESVPGKGTSISIQF